MPRKLTPQQQIVSDNIVNHYTKKLKDATVMNLALGAEIACNSILNMIEEGSGIQAIKDFCELNLKLASTFKEKKESKKCQNTKKK